MSENRLHDDHSVHGYVGRVCFKKGPPQHVGLELEWLVASTSDPSRPVPLDTLTGLLGDAAAMPAGSRATLEPGGQVELSSPVANDLSSCWRNLVRDTARLDTLLSRRDLAVLTVAFEPERPPRRLVRSPRYDAMQAYFDGRGDPGLAMMASTAAAQVNLDAGADDSEIARRWALLNALGPTLVAAFANSPVHRGRPTGWQSTRQRVWLQLDPSRTTVPVGPDPTAAWADYALNAPVMLCRRPDGWLTSPGFTFREWLRGVAGLPPPTEDDLTYHLSTLFPPVRPRGWLEVRYVDAQPPGLWPVPLAVLTALLNNEVAAERAAEATQPVRHRWQDAARLGLADPGLARSALSCFEAALDALPLLGADPALLALVGRFTERYVARGRSPADDALDEPPRHHQAPALATREGP